MQLNHCCFSHTRNRLEGSRNVALPVCTCGMLPVPRFLSDLGAPPLKTTVSYSSPSRKNKQWPEMEAALRAAGQEHVLRPPPPDSKREDFLAQLKSVNFSNCYKISTGIEPTTVSIAAKVKVLRLLRCLTCLC